MKNLTNVQKTIIGIVGAILVIGIIIGVILCFPEPVSNNNSELAKTESESLTDGSENSQNGTETADGTEIEGTENSTEAEGSTETEGTTENEGNTEDTEKESETESKPSTDDVYTPVTEFDSLSNVSQGWGPGGDRNELNQWYCCFSYNDKYGKYDAHFMVEDSKYIYLTMDEGYENGYTPAILDTLKEKNVKVVFFVTSQFVKNNPELVQRMIDEGHTVGNHSTSHPSKGMPSLSIEAQKNDIMGLHNMVKDQFGYEMNLFRNPAGIFSEQSLAVTNSCGYKSVFWSFAYLDYDTANQPDHTASLNKLMSNLHPGAIYLLHAVSETNTAILGDFIDQARAQGYEFAVFE